MRRQRAQSIALRAQADREAEAMEQLADAAKQSARQREADAELRVKSGGGGGEGAKLMNEDGDEIEDAAGVQVDAEGRRCAPVQMCL